MLILGINAYHGDASIVVVSHGKLVSAIEEERLNRMKHAAGLPVRAFREILKEAGLSPKDINYATISRNPSANLLHKLKFVLKNHPGSAFLKDRLVVTLDSWNVLKKLSFLTKKQEKGTGSEVLPVPFSWNGTKVEHVEHHLSHAASAFYPSGFERSAILTVDGFGDFSSTMLAVGEGNKIKVLKRIIFPHSLGVLYTAATQFLGFWKYGDEYKVMGLAAYGEPRFVKAFRELIRLEPNGTFKLNTDYFTHPKGKAEMTWLEGEPVLGQAYSEKWEKLFGTPRGPEESITQRDKDLAASVQAIFEETLFHLLRRLHDETSLKRLCFAGGCAFNSLANGKIFDETPFENVYIQPAAGDAGTALGSALYVTHHRLNQPRNFVMNHAYWGPEFGDAEIERALTVIASEAKQSDERRAPRNDGVMIEKMPDQDTLCTKTARAIFEGKVVGWFQGRMEWGPRALGNRSILADPRWAGMRDALNERIKLRENFRPFAPSVLEEKADDWFHMKSPSPFMNFVFKVRPEKRDRIPAVTHVDGTARVHTVSKETNPLFWNLISEFEKITGIPMVLNTSFNENEPIVCTPADAIKCFLRTKMHVLVLENYWLERQHAEKSDFCSSILHSGISR